MGMGVSTNSDQDVIMMLLSLYAASIAEGCMDFKDCEIFNGDGEVQSLLIRSCRK